MHGRRAGEGPPAPWDGKADLESCVKAVAALADKVAGMSGADGGTVLIGKGGVLDSLDLAAFVAECGEAFGLGVVGFEDDPFLDSLESVRSFAEYLLRLRDGRKGT